MWKRTWLLSILLAIFISTLNVLPGSTSHHVAQMEDSTSIYPNGTIEELPDAPLTFIENVGQFSEQASFQVPGVSSTLWVAEDGLWITLLESTYTSQVEVPLHVYEQQRTDKRQGTNLHLSFVDANPRSRIEPFHRLPATVNYFVGNDLGEWQSDVPTWGGVRYVDLYPGIDLELDGTGGMLEPRLVVRNVASLEQVRLRVQGAERIDLVGPAVEAGGGKGELHLFTTSRAHVIPLLRLVAPDGSEITPTTTPQHSGTIIAAPFLAPNLVATPSVNESQAGDAGLLYSSFFGGDADDVGLGIVVDDEGIYIGGRTTSSNFPTIPGAFDLDLTQGNADAFIAKFDKGSNVLLYSTFLGGDWWDEVTSIAVDSTGNAFLTGFTSSSDFPTTSDAFDRTQNNDSGGDVFVAKLNTDGSELIYSTYIGGSDVSGEDATKILVDKDGNAVITGWTYASDFPTTANGWDTTFNGSRDVFITTLNSTGSELFYSTFLGGTGDDRGNDLAIDPSGYAYVTGRTSSGDFPVSDIAFDTSISGDRDAFVSKLSIGSGTEGLLYSTFLGGEDTEDGVAIAVDDRGTAFITGNTQSVDFPTTPGAFQESRFNLGSGFVTKLSTNLDPTSLQLLYSTYINSVGDFIAIDGEGNAYIVGVTNQSDMSTTEGAFDSSFNGENDSTVIKLNASGSDLLYSTYLGGSGFDLTSDAALDDGYIYITGATNSADLPTTPNAFDPDHNGGVCFDGPTERPCFDVFVLTLAPVPVFTFDSNMSLVATIPSPSEVDLTPPVVATNLFMALLLAAGFGMITIVFNSTLEENEILLKRTLLDRLEPLRRHLPLHRLRKANFPENWRRHWLVALILLLFTALIYAFLDPTFEPSGTGASLVFELFLSLLLVFLAYDYSQGILAQRRHGRTGYLESFPVAIIIAVGCVLISRLLSFQPGYILGFVAAFVLSSDPAEDSLMECRQNGELILAGSFILLVVSLVAWLLGELMGEIDIIGDTMSLTFMAGLEGVLFTLLPLKFMDGATLYAWNRAAWFTMFFTASFWFCQILLNPNGEYSEAFQQANVQLSFRILVVYALLTALLWGYFVWRTRTKEAKP